MASRSTIRTERRGCFERTLEASSCTETLIAIRRDISARCFKNSVRPEGSRTCSSSDDALSFGAPPLIRRHIALRNQPNSLPNEPTVFGSAVRMTPNTSTMPTSSSDDMPASSAPSSSSREIAKLIVNDRSPAKPPNAFPSAMLRHVSDVAIRESVAEATHLEPCFDWQNRATLVVRRLVVTLPGEEADANMSCGSVFGTTLSNLLTFCRGSRYSSKFVLRMAHTALAPAADALACIYGLDKRHLVQSLATRITVKKQLRRLREVRDGLRWQGKLHRGVALGATAAILIAYSVLSYDDASFDADLDDGGLGCALDAALDAAQQSLNGWRIGAHATVDAARALGAERRALQRALVAVRYEKLHGPAELGAKSAFRRRLHAACAGAWPPNRELARDTHSSELERIALGIGAIGPPPRQGVASSAFSASAVGDDESGDDDDDDGRAPIVCDTKPLSALAGRDGADDDEVASEFSFASSLSAPSVGSAPPLDDMALLGVT